MDLPLFILFKTLKYTPYQTSLGAYRSAIGRSSKRTDKISNRISYFLNACKAADERSRKHILKKIPFLPAQYPYSRVEQDLR